MVFPPLIRFEQNAFSSGRRPESSGGLSSPLVGVSPSESPRRSLRIGLFTRSLPAGLSSSDSPRRTLPVGVRPPDFEPFNFNLSTSIPVQIALEQHLNNLDHYLFRVIIVFQPRRSSRATRELTKRVFCKKLVNIVKQLRFFCLFFDHRRTQALRRASGRHQSRTTFLEQSEQDIRFLYYNFLVNILVYFSKF